MKYSTLASGPSRGEIIMDMAPGVSNNNNNIEASHEIVDGSTTRNSREYFSVH